MLSTAPAVRDVGAFSLFADRVKIEFSEVLLDLRVVLSSGDGGLEPLWQALLPKERSDADSVCTLT